MEKLLEEYRYGYQYLRNAIEGLSEEELRFKPEADKWSIHQILIHVADSELVSTQRTKCFQTYLLIHYLFSLLGYCGHIA
jgi:uncharacterized damage-inducible protein DinB